jgi:hypothetical protein
MTEAPRKQTWIPFTIPQCSSQHLSEENSATSIAHLPVDHGRCWPLGRDRISVPVNELPRAAFKPEQTRHAQSERENFGAAADLRSPALDLYDTRELGSDVTRYEFCAGEHSVAIVGRRTVERLLDLVATARVRPEWITQRDIVSIREQNLRRFGIASENSRNGVMALLYRSVEILRFHGTSPQPEHNHPTPFFRNRPETGAPVTLT